MPRESKRPASQHPELDLRSDSCELPLEPGAKRFDIFLVDTGWNAAVSKAVRSHLETMFKIGRDDTFYILSPEQSVELMRRSLD